MTQPNYILGIKCKLFTNTGTYNSPVWTAISGFSDFTLNPEWNTTEGSTRGSAVVREAKTQLKLSVTGKVKVDPTDTNGWVALLAALNGYSPLDLLVMRGDPTDSTLTGTLTGYRADWHVKKMGESQGLGDVLFDDFEFTPALSANPTSAVSAAVTAGSPVYTYTAL